MENNFKECSVCDHLNDADDKFCKECGVQIDHPVDFDCGCDKCQDAIADSCMYLPEPMQDPDHIAQMTGNVRTH